MRVACIECGTSRDVKSDEPKALYRECQWFVNHVTNKITGEQGPGIVCGECEKMIFPPDFIAKCVKMLMA